MLLHVVHICLLWLVVVLSLWPHTHASCRLRWNILFFSKAFYCRCLSFEEKNATQRPKVETMWTLNSSKNFRFACSWTRKVSDILWAWVCGGNINWTSVRCTVHRSVTIISFVTLIVSTIIQMATGSTRLCPQWELHYAHVIQVQWQSTACCRRAQSIHLAARDLISF